MYLKVEKKNNVNKPERARGDANKNVVFEFKVIVPGKQKVCLYRAR